MKKKFFFILFIFLQNFLVYPLTFFMCLSEDYILFDRNARDEMYLKDEHRFYSKKNIIIKNNFTWSSGDLEIETPKNIIFEKTGKINFNSKNNKLILKAGMAPSKKQEYNSRIIFKGESPQIEIEDGSGVEFYYNPKSPSIEKKLGILTLHKYINNQNDEYKKYVKIHKNFKEAKTFFRIYMLINTIEDLQNINLNLEGNYALSHDIDASKTKFWNARQGFQPLGKNGTKTLYFSGFFNGCGYTIKNLFINRSDENATALFGTAMGEKNAPNKIFDLTLENFNINGNDYVGALIAKAENVEFYNIKIINPKIQSKNISGGFIGSGFYIEAENIEILFDNKNIAKNENSGLICGSLKNSKIQFQTYIDKTLLYDNLEYSTFIDIINGQQFIGGHTNSTIYFNILDPYLEPVSRPIHEVFLNSSIQFMHVRDNSYPTI